ncbi:MAG: hypothetical protein U0263_38555 [Polyangiaceae bacterium]
MRLLLADAAEVHLTHVDEPGLRLEGDAAGEGFGALQMLAGSLLLCSAAVLDTYAKNVLEVGVRGLRLSVRFALVSRPRRIGTLVLSVEWPELPENRVEAARRALETCTVHRTLEVPPEMRLEIRRSSTEA